MPPPTHADRVVSSQIDPDNHTEEFDLGNGVVVILDDTLGKVFISNQHGTFVYPLSDMFLQTAGGNAQEAAALRAQFHERLSDPTSAMGITQDTSNLSGLSDGYSLMLKQGPGSGGNNHSCSGFWDCVWFWMEWVGRTDLYWNYGLPDAGPSDPNDWNYWNQTQCDEVSPNMRHWGLAAGGAAVACGALGEDAGVSTGACLVNLGALGDTNYSLGRSLVNCHSVYVPH